eukprot:6572794-Heterocapsa_arctica.AAC.1
MATPREVLGERVGDIVVRLDDAEREVRTSKALLQPEMAYSQVFHASRLSSLYNRACRARVGLDDQMGLDVGLRQDVEDEESFRRRCC